MKVAIVIACCVVACSAQAQGTTSPAAIAWNELASSNDPHARKLVREITAMKWWDACIAWGRAYRSSKDERREKALLGYLMSERMLNNLDIGHAGDRTVDLGMTECGVYAAKGTPESANHTTTASGTQSQLVFPGRRLYIYTEPSRDYAVNVVRAIQH